MLDSKAIHSGDIGEAICLLRLLQMNVPARIVNLKGTDILCEIDDKVLRVQVKSARLSSVQAKRKLNYHFSICKGSKTKRSLSKNDCDVVALVGIEHEGVLFYPVCKFANTKTYRVTPTTMTEDNATQRSWKKTLNHLIYSI